MLMESQNRIIDAAGSKAINSETTNTDEMASSSKSHSKSKDMLAYVKTSIPIRIFKCMQRVNLLKCMKIFILQRMERTPMYRNSGNVTADFLDQILSNGQNASADNNGDGTPSEEIVDKYYLQMTELEINERLLKSFQRFFHDREIKLHFIPGMVVKVVPNEENAINLSLKRGKYERINYPHSFEIWRIFISTSLLASTWLEPRAKKGAGDYLLQLGIPAILMPAILMGSVIPFILPALKFATIFSGMINHAALLSAFAYVAKQTAFSPESIKHLYYSPPGYHRSLSD